MRNFTRVMSGVMGVLLASSAFTGLVKADEADYQSQYAMGALPVTQEQIAELEADIRSANPDYKSVDYISKAYNEGLPESIDLSQAPFFPEIGNQHGIGSCTAWATTYYQFTYEARKAYFQKYGKYTDVTYSPEYTYDLINQGVNEGSSPADAYDVLAHRGALKKDDFSPKYYNETYNENGYEWHRTVYDFRQLPTDVEKMREALNIRVVDCKSILINDNNLDDLKAVLSQGKVLVGCGTFDYDFCQAVDSDGKTVNVAYQNQKPDNNNSSHAIAIVGYDDNIECDINGSKDGGKMKGAFKVANSWGNEWENQGYCWIMYDAFKTEGYCPETEVEVKNGYSRCAAFDSNTFQYIDVACKDVKLVAQIDYATTNYDSLRVEIDNNTYLTDKEKSKVGTFGNSSRQYEGSLVFDVSEGIDSYTDDIKSRYFADMNYNFLLAPGDYYAGFHNRDNMIPVSIACDSMKLTDNLGNSVAGYTFGKINEFKKDTDKFSKRAFGINLTMNYSMGDVNYDHVFDSKDISMINEYLAGNREFSNLQKDMSRIDFNDDRVINTADADILKEYIDYQLSNTGKESVEQSDTGIRPGNFVAYDIDNDGNLDNDDITALINAIEQING